MPRKSAAALAIAPLALPQRPEPPKDLTAAQAEIWRTIVACRPPAYFEGACHEPLVAYCRHADTADVLAAAINACDPTDLRRYGLLLGMAARESAALSRLSAKLRLAPQHVRRIEQMVKSVGSVPWAKKPWERRV
jgi:hypothetical protein